jgi:NAD(P)H-hydrate repair Nnr-like enzyme with NAD(P)H-hydrate epimerase domain
MSTHKPERADAAVTFHQRKQGCGAFVHKVCGQAIVNEEKITFVLWLVTDQDIGWLNISVDIPSSVKCLQPKNLIERI